LARAGKVRGQTPKVDKQKKKKKPKGRAFQRLKFKKKTLKDFGNKKPKSKF
jgi:small subunit ribosomal protein S30e